MIALELYAQGLYRASDNPLQMYELVCDFDEVYELEPDVFLRINGNQNSYELIETFMIETYSIEFSNLIKVLVQDARLDEWPRFVVAFRDICIAKGYIQDVHIQSAKPLEVSIKKRIESQIKDTISGYCEFRYSVSPKLIHGYTITINHNIIDVSIKGTLDAIKREVLL